MLLSKRLRFFLTTLTKVTNTQYLFFFLSSDVSRYLSFFCSFYFLRIFLFVDCACVFSVRVVHPQTLSLTLIIVFSSRISRIRASPLPPSYAAAALKALLLRTIASLSLSYCLPFSSSLNRRIQFFVGASFLFFPLPIFFLSNFFSALTLSSRAPIHSRQRTHQQGRNIFLSSSS